MSNYVKDVSLELSEFKNTQEEKGGVVRRNASTTTAKSKLSKVVEAVLNPNDQNHSKRRRFVPRWDIIFIISSAFAVFTDPLICYIPVIEEETCYIWDHTLMWTFLALRSTGDIMYTVDIVVFLRRSRGKGKSSRPAWINVFGDPCTKISKVLQDHRKSLVFLRILPRIWAAFPLLQAMILVAKYTYLDNTLLFYLIPFQYSVRAYNLYRWLDEHAQIDTAIKRFIKALLDFLPFVLAAHLFGALWYYFAVERQVHCWSTVIRNCIGIRECRLRLPQKLPQKARNMGNIFYCNKYMRYSLEYRMYMEHLSSEFCAVEVTQDVPTLPYDFGIYLYALQSDLTRTRYLPKKILQCFWWGLRNLSSFGSNLQTSFHKDEIILSIVICISGLALFLVYLNARVQGLQKISNQLKLREKKLALYPDLIDQARNMRLLRLALLQKVSMLQGTDAKVLEAICWHLKPVTYGGDSYIIREGQPLLKMVFITQGSALMYTNNSSNGGTNICGCLEKNDYYGEELLNWAFKFASFSELPVSTRTVFCQTKVEAYAITANNLKSVVAEYWWHFRKDFSPPQLEQLAASSLAAAWRRYYARARARISERATQLATAGPGQAIIRIGV